LGVLIVVLILIGMLGRNIYTQYQVRQEEKLQEMKERELESYIEHFIVVQRDGKRVASCNVEVRN
jgi:hypothetical protein